MQVARDLQVWEQNISKSASEEGMGDYVTTGCYIILINKAADGENQPIIAPKPHCCQWWKNYADALPKAGVGKMEKPSSPVKSAASKLYPLQFGFHDESTIDTDGEDTLRRKWGQRL